MPSARAVLFLVLIAVVYVHTAASAPKTSPRVRVVQKIPVGHTPQSLTLTPDGTELYVTLRDTESLVVISTKTRQITHKLTIGLEPWGGVALPDGSKIIIGCRVAVTIISVTDKHVEIVRCCGWVLDIAVTRDGRTVYLAGERAGLFHMALTPPSRCSSQSRCRGETRTGRQRHAVRLVGQQAAEESEPVRLGRCSEPRKLRVQFLEARRADHEISKTVHQPRHRTAPAIMAWRFHPYGNGENDSVSC